MVRNSIKYTAIGSIGAIVGFTAGYRIAVADYVKNNGETLDAVADSVYDDFDKEEIEEARNKLRSAIEQAREMDESDEEEGDEPRRMIQ